MATQSDGKVTLDTALDNSGLFKGIKAIKGDLGGLNGVAKKLGATIAAVFSMQQLVSFMVDSSKAAMSLSDALTGLKSILEGQGKSFSQAQTFIEEYTSDGLIPATNAITAYKNLASRGYDDSQIQQVMLALKDASAYGRQASYTMGEAVQSATEGLKNENSILVDNAGVTKNVAKMWEEYAESIGTTANNLTQEQKIQAEVNGILEESKYQTGDAATVANTLSGQLQQLSFNFNNLKVAVGNAINPIVQSFLPIINTAISTLVRFANAVASVIGLIFGKVSTSAGNLAESNDSVASSASAGAAAEEELADAASAAGKAAKKSLSSFDELNKLQSDAGGGGSSSGSSGGVSSGGGISVTADTTVEDTVSPKIQAIADKIHALLEPLKQIDFGPAIDAFGRLGDAAGDLGETIGDALEWAWFNILVPLEKWRIEEAAPATVNLLSDALGVLSAALEPVQAGLEELFADLTPVFDFIGDTVLVILDEFQKAFQLVAQVFREKGPEIEGIVSGVGDVVSAIWKLIKPILYSLRDTWVAVFRIIAEAGGEQLGYLVDVLYGVVELIAGVLTGDWERAWTGLKTAAKGTINSIIGFINGMIRAVQSAVNALISAINQISFTVPDWIPGVGGKKVGFSLKMASFPTVPYLAQGAVLPANKPFLAMVGDQKHGTNVEAPLSTIQEAVALVMEDMTGGMMAGFEALLAENQALRRVVESMELDGEMIAKSYDRHKREIAVVKGV